MDDTITEAVILKFIFENEHEKAKRLLCKFLKDIFNHLSRIETKKVTQISTFSIVTDAIFYFLTKDSNYTTWHSYTEELKQCLNDSKFPNCLRAKIVHFRDYHEKSPIINWHSNEKILLHIIEILLNIPHQQEMEIDLSQDKDCIDKLTTLNDFTNLTHDSSLEQFTEFRDNFNKSLTVLKQLGPKCSITYTNFSQYIKDIINYIEDFLQLMGAVSFVETSIVVNSIYSTLQINKIGDVLLSQSYIQIGKEFRMLLSEQNIFEADVKHLSIKERINYYARKYFVSNLKTSLTIHTKTDYICFQAIQSFIDSRSQNTSLIEFQTQIYTLIGTTDVETMGNFLTEFGVDNIVMASRELSTLYEFTGATKITVLNKTLNVYVSKQNSNLGAILNDVSSVVEILSVSNLTEGLQKLKDISNLCATANYQTLYNQMLTLKNEFNSLFEDQFSLAEISKLIASIKDCQKSTDIIPGETFNDKLDYLNNELLTKLNKICSNITYEDLIHFLIQLLKESKISASLDENSIKGILEQIKNYNSLVNDFATLQKDNTLLNEELKNCEQQKTDISKKLEQLETQNKSKSNENQSLKDNIYQLEISLNNSKSDVEKQKNQFQELETDLAILQTKYDELLVNYNDLLTSKRVAVTLPIKRKTRQNSPSPPRKSNRREATEPSS